MTSLSFSNTPLAEAQLPTTEALEFIALSPRYRWLNIGANFTIFTVLFLVSFALYAQTFFQFPEEFSAIIAFSKWIVLTLGVVVTLYHFFADPIKRYALREQDISFTSGLFFRKTVTQPVLRIQHIELQRGPLERKFGLATLQIFSAGGVMHTFEIPGLALEKAQQLRQFILQHKDVAQHG
ncbi:PH domain-containing protein [Flocculibacter collagenilyticus]|uniref:PH domain-containing protein n=1 Tax=Flocculibacter collagenilyticus TaxID=2744479 RepID=UPI0018F5094E|nr:PH domain-containing protein [Flocculibacter collagenilyticus]